MSCLSLDELSLSEQAAVQQSCTAAIETRVRALLAPFELPAEPATPCAWHLPAPPAARPTLPSTEPLA